MTIESANSPFVGESETNKPSISLDDAANLAFDEPEEANEDGEQEEQSASETGEANEDAGQETDETAAEGEEPSESEEDDAANGAPDTIVTLKGGEQVPLEELKLGYMRDRDYRHKTQEIGNKSRNLEAMTTRVANTAGAIADFLASQMPPEPSPALAMQNPGEYTRQKAMYDAALSQVHKLIDIGAEPKAVAGEMRQAASAETLAAENAKLLETFPQARTKEGREKFFAEAFETARDIGFTDAELTDITDHRMFKLAHYARLGLAAEKAKGKALEKVAAAPPAPKVKPKGPVNPQARQNQEAMKRLAKTGSIRDAMAIDFD